MLASVSFICFTFNYSYQISGSNPHLLTVPPKKSVERMEPIMWICVLLAEVGDSIAQRGVRNLNQQSALESRRVSILQSEPENARNRRVSLIDRSD